MKYRRLFVGAKHLSPSSRQLGFPSSTIRAFFFAFFLSFFSILSHAALDIEVTRAMDAAMPIAIVPFEGDGQGSTEVADVVAQDLHRSGEFAPLDPAHMAQKPNNPVAVNTDYWRQLKMDAMVVGSVISQGGDRYKVQYYLIDLYGSQATNKTPLLDESFTVTGQQLRGLAHHISDRIYEKLTGHKGAFATRIAYVNVKWHNGKLDEYRLEIADSDGYNPRALLTSREPIMSPSWSPNGKELAYVSFENNRAQIFISTVATGQRRLISKQPGINGAPAWSPDGSKLAIVLSNQSVPKIYLMNLATNQLEQVTTGPSIDTEPRFSPDGRSLFYTSNRGGQPQIYRVDLGSRAIERVTFEGDFNARGIPTSDGKSIIMIHRENGMYHIAVQDLKTKQMLVLTQTKLDQSPSLAPNDRMIIYSTLVGNKRVLSACSVDGRVKLLIPIADGEVQDPAWSPYQSS
ncbi:MAG: Tol-Pal system beta propeller repeat protein TolB [Gammaproteobacteria bacterium]